MNWLWMAVAIAMFVRATRSPLIKAPAHRALFLLVIVGALLIGTLPEAAFVLPALDAVGLDIVTILVALELRHYILFLRDWRACRHPSTVFGVDLHRS